MSSRFIPSLRQLRTAADRLPNPQTWPDETYIVPTGRGLQRTLTFRRVAFDEGEGEREQRWVYEGKIFMPTGGRDHSRRSDSEPDSSSRRRRRSQSKKEESA